MEKISGSSDPWHEIREGDVIALRAYNGKYVHIQNGTGPLSATSDVAGALETFTIEAVEFQPVHRPSPIPARLVVEAGPSSGLEDVRSTVRTTLAMPGTIKVEPLFPRADPQDQVFKLANFFLVTLAVTRESLGIGALHDYAYELREAGNFENVWPEGLFSGFYPPPGGEESSSPPGTESPSAPPKPPSQPPPPGTESPPVPPKPPSQPPPSEPPPFPPIPQPPGPYVPMLTSTSSTAEAGATTPYAPGDMGWSHRKTRLPQAWELSPPVAGGRQRGAGIVIAQLDTGWTAHPELDCTSAFNCSLDLDRQFNTLEVELDPPRWEDQRSAKDPKTWFDWVHAHGTATGSVLISEGWVEPSEQQPDPTATKWGTKPLGGIVGVAPDATMIPIRCVDAVILGGVPLGATPVGVAAGLVVGDVEVARAVHYAAEQNVHVITMSLGGYPTPFLESVVAHAIHRKNIIFCAAAGNYWNPVVFPAGYKDCIAVGGTTPDDSPWEGSAQGNYAFGIFPSIDICAPGEWVWVADWTENDEPEVRGGKGTSFATPHVAGAAALWLAYHGRNRLLNLYRGKASLQDVYKALLEKTARKPGASWDTNKYGPGILNVEALLKEPLPDPNAMPEKGILEWARTSALEILYQLYHHLDPVLVRDRLAKILDTTTEVLEERLEDIGSELQKFMADNREAFESMAASAATTTVQVVQGVRNAAQKVTNSISRKLRGLMRLVSSSPTSGARPDSPSPPDSDIGPVPPTPPTSGAGPVSPPPKKKRKKGGKRGRGGRRRPGS